MVRALTTTHPPTGRRSTPPRPVAVSDAPAGGATPAEMELISVTSRSAGCAALDPDEPSAHALLRAADVGLFVAKRQGSNRVAT